MAPEKIIAVRNQPVNADITLQIRNGYHVNSTTPADEYLIPLKLTWADPELKVDDVSFPEPKMEKFSFSEKPVSVFEGDVKIRTRLRVLPIKRTGLTSLNGKLRYQACNDRMCLPPRTLDIKIPLEIRD